MIEQNVENEARPEAARRRGACHAERKNEPLVPGIGRRAAVCGLGAAALWDLEIDLALYSPGFLPAVLMEAFGWFPQYLPAVVLCVCIALGRCAKHAAARRGRPAGGCRQRHPAVYGRAPSCKARDVRPFHHTVDRPAGRPFAGYMRTGAVPLPQRGAQKAGIRRPFGARCICWPACRTNIIKGCPGSARALTTCSPPRAAASRARSHSLQAGCSRSATAVPAFPSGHTAAACSVFILTLACDVCLKWNRRRTLVWALCWAYVAFMALCRLVIGRHYLSDTLAAAFVMLLLLPGHAQNKMVPRRRT